MENKKDIKLNEMSKEDMDEVVGGLSDDPKYKHRERYCPHCRKKVNAFTRGFWDYWWCPICGKYF